MPTLAQIAAHLNASAPERIAESWDNVGLQIGDPALEARGVLTTLECDPATVEEAIAADANVIVAHHPLIFRPPKSILTNTYTGATIGAILAARMGFIAAHTNLDKAPWGTNRIMADRLGLTDLVFLHPEGRRRLQKLVVFVPDGHERAIVDAIDASGGGHIGRYRRCSFRTRGIGGFEGDETTNPAIGTAGEYEETDEWRLETVAPADVMPRVVEAVVRAHPYEEVAYDVYPLEKPDAAPEWGLGYVGTLPVPASAEPPTLATFARDAAKAFHTDFLLVVGEAGRPIRRVAVSSGSGGHSVAALPGDMADVLVTGEMTYHHAVEARHKGWAVVCVGHFASETFVAPEIARHIAARFPGLRCAASASSSDPFWRP